MQETMDFMDDNFYNDWVEDDGPGIDYAGQLVPDEIVIDDSDTTEICEGGSPRSDATVEYDNYQEDLPGEANACGSDTIYSPPPTVPSENGEPFNSSSRFETGATVENPEVDFYQPTCADLCRSIVNYSPVTTSYQNGGSSSSLFSMGTTVENREVDAFSPPECSNPCGSVTNNYSPPIATSHSSRSSPLLGVGTTVENSLTSSFSRSKDSYSTNYSSPFSTESPQHDELMGSNSLDNLLNPAPTSLPHNGKRKKPAQSKEEQRRQKNERVALRRLEQERQKNMKTAIASQQRSRKPEEVIKSVTVHIDTQIINSSAGTDITSCLQKEGIRYCVRSLLIPNTIIWTKVVKELGVDSLEDVTDRVQEESQILKLVGWWDFVSWVSKGELLKHVRALQSAESGKKLTLVIVGMEKYLAFQANKMNKAMKAALTGNQPRGKKVDGELAAAPDVAPDDVEMALTEAQLLTNCCHKNVENAQEVATTVLQMTRSISQIEYKREQYSREKDTVSWFAKADGKSCVKVDKNGNGLLELWQQQICQFNNVGLEVAQAIVGQYPSPLALLTAYRRCSDSSAAAGLLGDIAVRRDAGILSSSRRIGPELSKKIYRFMTATDPNSII